jgi:hypothetical protein
MHGHDQRWVPDQLTSLGQNAALMQSPLAKKRVTWEHSWLSGVAASSRRRRARSSGVGGSSAGDPGGMREQRLWRGTRREVF